MLPQMKNPRAMAPTLNVEVEDPSIHPNITVKSLEQEKQ